MDQQQEQQRQGAGGPTDDLAPTTPPPAPPQQRSTAFRWWMLLVVLLLSVSLDQWSKHWAQTELQTLPGRSITLVPGYAGFTYVRNPGAAWGFLARSDVSFRRPFFLGMTVLAMIFMGVIFVRLEESQRWLLWALALILSGALGNFIDRLRFNYVVDFIDLHLEGRFYWPKFNIADVAITVGVVMLLLEMVAGPWWRRRAARKGAAGGARGEEPLPPDAAGEG